MRKQGLKWGIKSRSKKGLKKDQFRDNYFRDFDIDFRDIRKDKSVIFSNIRKY